MINILQHLFSTAKGRPNRKIVLIALLAVITTTFLCFAPDLGNGLLDWDDNGFITENVRIRSLDLQLVRWAFTAFYASYWGPLVWLSFALDYAIWGLNPLGYHLTNDLLHALNAGLFFLLSWRLLNIYIDRRTPQRDAAVLLNPGSAFFCSVLAALLFALHPLRVESVAWATERKDVLSLFFGIPAMLAYLAHVRMSPARNVSGAIPFFLTSPYYYFALLLYALSLSSKPILVTLSFVLLVLDWFPLDRFRTTRTVSLLIEKVPLLLLAVITSMLTTASQMTIIESQQYITLASRLLNACKSILAYVWLTIWPVDISPFYVHPVNIDLAFEYLLPIILIIVITVLCVLYVKRLPVLLCLWSLYLITLAPVLGLVQVGPQAMAARYTYLPGLLLALLAALGITALLVRLSGSRATFTLVALGVPVLLVFYCYQTVHQTSFWKDDVTLWTRAIDLQPHYSGRAYFQRGCAYAAQGNLRSALADMNEAYAIAVKKQYRQMHTIYAARARIFKRMGNLDDAIADYTSALSTAEGTERSKIYRERGKVYLDLERPDLASEDFSLAGTGELRKNKE